MYFTDLSHLTRFIMFHTLYKTKYGKNILKFNVLYCIRFDQLNVLVGYGPPRPRVRFTKIGESIE